MFLVFGFGHLLIDCCFCRRWNGVFCLVVVVGEVVVDQFFVMWSYFVWY